MEFKAKEIKVTKELPFDNDKLNRKEEIKNLGNLLLNITTPIVLSINSPWGTGKTTFVKMLNAYLDSKKEEAIYFNAWETDFATDPLLAFLGEINIAMEKHIGSDNKKKIAWEKAKKAGVFILKKGLPALLKIGSANLIDALAIQQELSKSLDDISTGIIDNYTKDKEAIIQFKENIATVLATNKTEKKKLYIFVDELDRCRPTYAIELLERIKHLLNIEGIVFILSLDKVQLSYSVKSLYGAKFEAIGYLRRFIDIEYQLEQPNLEEFIEAQFNNLNLISFFESRSRNSNFLYESIDIMSDVIQLLAKANKLSLREVEQLITNINLIILSSHYNDFLHPPLLCFLLVTKEKEPSIYHNFLKQENSPEEIIEYLYSYSKANERYNSDVYPLIEGFLIAAKKLERGHNIGDSLQKHKIAYDKEALGNDERYYSEIVIAIVEKPIARTSFFNFDGLVKRINLLEKFKFTTNDEKN